MITTAQNITQGFTLDASQLLNILFGLIQALVGAICVHLYKELGKANDHCEKLSSELATHKLHTAENYMTKTELTRAFDAINRTLESLSQAMTQRFDRMDSKLDKKMDRE